MDQRDSIDRSSSELPASAPSPARVIPNGAYVDSSNVISASAQMPPSSHSVAPANEISPIVDGVLQSDVCLHACFYYKVVHTDVIRR